MRAICDGVRCGIELQDGTFIGIDRSAKVRREREQCLLTSGYEPATDDKRAEAEREIREAIAIQTGIAKSRALSGRIEWGEA